METVSKRPIVLIGLMGSGKTSVGKSLARRSGWPFVDIDHLVEEKAGIAISQIFEKYGEARFRELEHEALREALEKEEPAIIATGGGAVVRPENRELLWKRAFVVYLHASVPGLLERLQGSTHRPLLQRPDRAQVLEKLYEERRAYYEEAHYMVNVESRSLHELSGAIWSAYRP
jgi:shikimate kinase